MVSSAADRSGGEAYLRDLISLGRMPRDTRAVVEVGSLATSCRTGKAADLHILGFTTRSIWSSFATVSKTGAPCVFVHDSGHESALA